jgi:deoxyguanosine kinase
MERIALRDRPYERAMERDYIAQLGQAYDEFYAHYTLTPVLTLDSNRLDFVRHPDDLRMIIDRIRAKLELGARQYPLFENGGGA